VDKVSGAARTLESHGVDFIQHSDGELLGNCPWCERDKFYFNINKRVWDCKFCEIQGNVEQFLARMAETYEEDLTNGELKKLSDNRGLPLSAFKGWGLGWNGAQITIPVWRRKGGKSAQAIDIRRFNIGKGRLLSTPGCKVGILGGERLAADPRAPVYICEGEWDAIALAWLLKKLKKPGVVVGIPGAGTFKDEWVNLFANRNVFLLYDNDAPGANGESKAYWKLEGTARSVKCLHWHDKCPEGWDIRDWIREGAIDQKIPEKCFSALMKYMKDTPRHKETGGSRGADAGAQAQESEEDERPPAPWVPLNEVMTCFKKWLKLKDTTAIEVAMACYISNYMDGDPLWIFLTAPPGSAKTEILRTMDDATDTVFRESITPHSLISGLPVKKGYEPSLLPQLDGQTLVIKDFTPILGLSDQDQEEIFSTLRAAYDGKVSKHFGTGEKEFVSRFTILAAVTPKIYEAMASNSALGERFLNFFIGESLDHEDEIAILKRTISHAGLEIKMRNELNMVMRGFIENVEIPEITDIALDPEVEERILPCAQVLARLRGTVSRDKYRGDFLLGKSSTELPTRVLKQLLRLGKAMSVVRERSTVTMTEYDIMRKAARDSCNQMRLEIMEIIWQTCRDDHDSILGIDLMTLCAYPRATTARILDDLCSLRILTKPDRREFMLHKGTRELIDESLFFDKKSEPVRRKKKRKGITIRRRK